MESWNGSSWYWIFWSSWWITGKNLTVQGRCPVHIISTPRWWNLSPHHLFYQPSLLFGKCFLHQWPASQKALQEMVSLALFVATLLFSLLVLLLLYLIFNLRLQCWKKRHNAEDVDEATWSQSHTKSNKLLQYLLVRSTYCFTSFPDTSLTVKNNLTWQ